MVRHFPVRRDAGLPAGTVAWIYLAVGALAVAACVVSNSPTASTLLMLVCIGATAVGVRRQPVGPRRRPWWAIVAAQSCFVGASLVRALVPGTAAADPAGTAAFLPDLLFVPGYLVLVFAILSMLRLRSAQADVPARADAVLVGVGVALATWAFLITPRLEAPTVSAVSVSAAFFPVADVVLFVMVCQLMIAGGVRQLAQWLLGLAMLGMFVGDYLYALEIDQVAGSTTAQIINVAFLGAYVMIAGAVMHPTSLSLTQPQNVDVRAMGPGRVAGIAAILIGPMVLATIWPTHTRWAIAVRIAIYALLVAIVVGRIVFSNNSQERAERAARAAEQRARHRATHDSLTDLPNRERLADVIAEWSAGAAAAPETALVLVDLDHFKMVNDSWGHAVGDELLCAVADRLSAAVRDTDVACRIGGDEFAVATRSPAAAQDAASLAGRLLVDLARPFPLSVGDVAITVSIGLAHARGETTALDLIRDCDIALYRAKDSGRNRHAHFDDSLRRQLQRRAELEQRLRGALERGELEVHYQPIVALDSGALCGFEALMRWTSPELGAVSPVEFIPIAEDTGFIVPAGAWVLGEAARQLATWRAARPD